MGYRIRPLEWEDITAEIKATDVLEYHQSNTPIGHFSIEKMKSEDWYYHFCFAEYHDEGGGGCKDLEDGKDMCEKIWEGRLKKCLIKEKEE